MLFRYNDLNYLQIFGSFLPHLLPILIHFLFVPPDYPNEEEYSEWDWI